MKTNTTSPNRNNQKLAKQEKKSSGMLRIFSIVMLLLIVFSSFGRIATANHRTSSSGQNPPQQAAPSSGVGTSARVLVFHREDKRAGVCENLVITAEGDVVYSNCRSGEEKQHTLSETDRQQLKTWIQKFQAVNYDHTAPAQADGEQTQLYLNGQGSQKATDLEIQQMIDFASVIGNSR